MIIVTQKRGQNTVFSNIRNNCYLTPVIDPICLRVKDDTVSAV